MRPVADTRSVSIPPCTADTRSVSIPRCTGSKHFHNNIKLLRTQPTTMLSPASVTLMNINTHSAQSHLQGDTFIDQVEYLAGVVPILRHY